jgi:2-aminoadipate transaminase
MNEPVSRLFSDAVRTMKHSFIREILKMTIGVPGMISFAGGLPSPESFPKDLLSGLFKDVLSESGQEVLQYGTSDGDAVLKRAVKVFLGAPDLPDEEMMITVGSTNSIYYYTRTLINPGDIVISEAPGFPGSLAAMEACGARFAGVEMDDFGMLPDRLEATLKKLRKEEASVKFIYVIPEFQNPSGRTMDIGRRRAIIETAKTFDLPILEDQPYQELRYGGDPIPTLWELARTEFRDPETVTLCKSFSKILGPGLRLGFTCAAPVLIDPMVKWQQKITVSPDCVTQRVAAGFMEKGYMEGQIAKIIDLYRPRRDAMLEALKNHMPEAVRWTRPEGGMFIWVTFPQDMDTDRLLERALKNKVAFIPGAKFYPEGIIKRNELRLNFSYAPIDQIHEGIRRLAELL